MRPNEMIKYLLWLPVYWLYQYRLIYGLLGMMISPVLLLLLIQSLLPGDIYEARESAWRSLRQLMKTPKTKKLILWLFVAQVAQWLMFIQCTEGPLWQIYW